jgi:hypothetical protein
MDDATLSLFDELDDLRDRFVCGQFAADGFDRLAGVEFRAIDQAECFFDQLDAFWRITLRSSPIKLTPQFRPIHPRS